MSEIFEFLEKNNLRLYTMQDLALKTNLQIEQVEEQISGLEGDHKIIRTKKGRIGLPSAFGIITGVIHLTAHGYGFLIPDDSTIADIYIHQSKQLGALHGDRVYVNMYHRKGKQEGEVIKVTKRAHLQIVGTYNGKKTVFPDDSKFGTDVTVRHSTANAGDKVVVKIEKYYENGQNPQGKIVEVLGKTGDSGVDILSVAKTYGLETSFPPAVLKEADALSQQIELGTRTDFRQEHVVTIDGKDSKDFDDAIHIKKNEGYYELGVHIADVSHYVLQGTALDKEAYQRGTSVYLLSEVIPMLPEVLSNGICSLNPGVDRYTLSVIMDILPNGQVENARITEGVIRSSYRLNYDDVSDYLEGNMTEAVQDFYPVHEDLTIMAELSEILRIARAERGAIDFDFPEPNIMLDEQGVPVNVTVRDRRGAHKMIEDFMLIANETVAARYSKKEGPFLFRVHEQPSDEKIDRLHQYLKSLQLSFRLDKDDDDIQPRVVADFIHSIKDNKQVVSISRMTLRAMMQAKYSPKDEGHFGLAATHYCHFTSPIRRYPDLFVHRVIKQNIKAQQQLAKESLNIEKIAAHCSDRERNAENAERQVLAMKSAEYMKQFIGASFEGTITSVTSFGFFVELENMIDGLVHISTLPGEPYSFDEQSYRLIGRHTGRQYGLGDRVEIVVEHASPDTRKIDFVLKGVTPNDVKTVTKMRKNRRRKKRR